MFKSKSNTQKKSWNPFGTKNESKPSMTHSQTMMNVSRLADSSPSPRRSPSGADMFKRQSMMISEPVQQSRAIARQKYKSHYDFSSFKVDSATVSDPREIEFYEQLLQCNESEFDDSDDNTLNSADLEKVEMPSQGYEETLSSTLEDYKLFTGRQEVTTEITQLERTDFSSLISHPSVPSLSSFDSITSETSVLRVSNSIWVGFSDELESDKLKLDAFDKFDANAAFGDDSEDYFVSAGRDYTSHRTSLIFV
jgi:hypothetical protein